MNTTSPNERPTMTINTFTMTEDRTAAASFPMTFDTTIAKAVARFEERARDLGQRCETDWRLTLWFDGTILEEASFISQATLDARK